jgi:hypothetical protein
MRVMFASGSGFILATPRSHGKGQLCTIPWYTGVTQSQATPVWRSLPFRLQQTAQAMVHLYLNENFPLPVVEE